MGNFAQRSHRGADPNPTMPPAALLPWVGTLLWGQMRTGPLRPEYNQTGQPAETFWQPHARLQGQTEWVQADSGPVGYPIQVWGIPGLIVGSILEAQGRWATEAGDALSLWGPTLTTST